MSSFIDIHTHTSNGVAIYSCSPKEFDQSLQIKLSGLYSIGIHPWYINQATDEDLDLLRVYAQHEAVLAIGETGLDKLCDTSFEKQASIFRQHIELSEKHHKPLIVHCVKAYNELMQLRKELNPNQTWILHGYRGKPELTQQLLQSGFYFSFGNGISHLEKTIELLPLDKIFLETDDLSISIDEQYALFARIKSLEIDELKAHILDNFHRIFGKSLILSP